MFLELYVFMAIVTGVIYTWFVYYKYRLDGDLKRLGLAKAHLSLQYLFSGVLMGLVFVMTTLLAPLVWLDVIMGNAIPKEVK